VELDKIAITGMGAVNSIANNVIEFSNALKAGTVGIRKIETAGLKATSLIGMAPLKEDSSHEFLNNFYHDNASLKNKINKIYGKATDTVKAAIRTSLEAWSSAKLNDKKINSERIGVIVAGSNLMDRDNFNCLEKFKNNLEYTVPSYALQSMDTNVMAIISELLGIHGEGFTVGGASASGNVAIVKGLQLIQLGIIDCCVVIGAMADLSPATLQSYYNLGALGGKKENITPEEICRPFDNGHDGFVYGQGCGALVLESMSSAKKRKVPILAELLSGVIVIDANHLTNPSTEGEMRCMKKAITQAGKSIGDIEYINAHGTSTPLGDVTELDAIKKLFGKFIKHIWINSTKGLIGHCLYSAGILEAIATIIQMNEKFIHPSVNLSHAIDDDFRFSSKNLENVSINTALSNSFGFGGINTSIILKR